MKTLIINGSPRPNGDTAKLVSRLAGKLSGEVKIIDAYRSNISPCVDCRFCWTHEGCAVNDEMQAVYEYIKTCDCIVIASPVYFSELTGKTLDFGSRLQTYFCSRFFRKADPAIRTKKGGIILVGGGDGSLSKAEDTAKVLLAHMNCRELFPTVSYHNTNLSPAADDAQTLEKTDRFAAFLNSKQTHNTEDLNEIL
ncbi:MAG: flavodoxin family protein [Clostridia bacterium]|nr:flavodoxin family protein [Clostridia bacterium]